MSNFETAAFHLLYNYVILFATKLPGKQAPYMPKQFTLYEYLRQINENSPLSKDIMPRHKSVPYY